MATFHVYEIPSEDPDSFLANNEKINETTRKLDWHVDKLAYCRLRFTDVDAYKAVDFSVSANSQRDSVRPKPNNVGNSKSVLLIDHFDDVFKGDKWDYITVNIYSASSEDIEVFIQFFFTDKDEPAETRFPVTLKQKKDTVVNIAVALA